ncbi:iron export ABC transporter permease subunit FetB [Legionella israelensis]|uniref:ABC transporter permease n=1 Tax=Legionella israelensis TaxID=454 RepID=UPI0011814C27|nr:iron export ABC transporter permease subunit FetB [Legionella israelensis]QDP71227.1 iron export ABC transporter permease subunit FetB [Legionella israelensis]
MDIINLSWIQLSLAFLSLLVPAYILWTYETRLNKKMVIASLRMVVQLLFVGFYMEYLFQLDNPWINVAWILVMVAVANLATIDRSELRFKKETLLPLFFATLLGVVITDIFFLNAVIQLPKTLAAQYTIPITGMVLGNCLTTNVIGLNAFFYGIKSEEERYQFYLACGASRSEALTPFISEAIRKSANPTLASMASIGLVYLPGMMTGQILSGSPPIIAIKYQIMIMFAIFLGTILSLYLGIQFAGRYVFKDTDMLDESLLRN